MTSYISFPDLIGLVTSGVTLHNILRFAATKLSAVAKEVESGSVPELVKEAETALAFAKEHDPKLVNAVETEAAKLKDEALAEINKARHAAAEVLRNLAADVERLAGAEPAPVVTDPAPPAGA
jgi:DNA repair ATPase RecN